jgi:hypothetical protein
MRKSAGAKRTLTQRNKSVSRQTNSESNALSETQRNQSMNEMNSFVCVRYRSRFILRFLPPQEFREEYYRQETNTK